ARAAPPMLAATWQEAGGAHAAGLLAATPDGLRVVHREPVPTRAHGVLAEPGGTLLVVARRPGDWLVRLDPSGRAPPGWYWSEDEHVFNGHVVLAEDRRRLFTTETSLLDGTGSIGVRDART